MKFNGNAYFWSAVYSAFCNIVCDVYRDFSEKRDLSGKWCRYAVIGAMILADYFISVKLDGDIILKEIAIIVTGTLFYVFVFQTAVDKNSNLCFVISGNLFCDGLYFYYNAV